MHQRNISKKLATSDVSGDISKIIGISNVTKGIS